MRFALLRAAACLALFAIVACRHDGAATSAATPAALDAAFVLPGAFSEQTTVADLEALFGAANVTIGAVPNAVGDPDRGIVLFPDDPTRRAYVRFYEEEPLNHLASVTVTDPESRWRGKRGVRVGMSLAELRERNASRFWLYGFYDDGMAIVRDMWNAGALDVAEGDKLYFGVDVRLRSTSDAKVKAILSREADQISSDDPNYAILGELAEVVAISAWSSLDDEW
jgi:hypothetical protein